MMGAPCNSLGSPRPTISDSRDIRSFATRNSLAPRSRLFTPMRSFRTRRRTRTRSMRTITRGTFRAVLRRSRSPIRSLWDPRPRLRHFLLHQCLHPLRVPLLHRVLHQRQLPRLRPAQRPVLCLHPLRLPHRLPHRAPLRHRHPLRLRLLPHLRRHPLLRPHLHAVAEEPAPSPMSRRIIPPAIVGCTRHRTTPSTTSPRMSKEGRIRAVTSSLHIAAAT